MTVRRTFVEKSRWLVTGVVFFGLCMAWLVWDMFIEGADSDRLLALGPTSVVGWLLLAAGGLMVGLSLNRLLFARRRVLLEPDHVRFGTNGRQAVARTDIADVIEVNGVAEIQLRDPRDPQVRSRAGMFEGHDTVELHPVEYRNGHDLVPSVLAWYRNGG